MTIAHKVGKDNVAADALSRNPNEKPPPKGIAEDEVQVALVSSSANDISSLLSASPCTNPMSSELPMEQRKDPALMALTDHLGETDTSTRQVASPYHSCESPNY